MMRHTPSGRPVADYIDLVDRPEGTGVQLIWIAPEPERGRRPSPPPDWLSG
jgi:hypothetical protein